MHGRGCAWLGAYMAGEMATETGDTIGMHSCLGEVITTT